jgi:outer membrane lipoprotein-sorting protein
MSLLLALLLQDPAADALKRLAERMKDVRVLTCTIRQERRTALIERPLTSAGTMAYRRDPGRLVFRLTEPRASEIHMDRGAYQVYRPDEKRLERIEFEDDALTGQLLALFDPKPETVGKRFAMKRVDGPDGLIELRFDPVDEQVKRRVASISLTLGEADATIRRIRYVQADGDAVSFDLSDVRLNPELPPSTFDLKVPEGTRVLTHKVGK